MAVIEINNPIVDQGRIAQSAGTPTAGTFGAGVLGPGRLAQDTTNAKLFINTGTKAVPVWTVVGTQT